jgi:hypothetical protein
MPMILIAISLSTAAITTNCNSCTFLPPSITTCTGCQTNYVFNTGTSQCDYCNTACTAVSLTGCGIVDSTNSLGLCNQANCGCLTCTAPYVKDLTHNCVFCNSSVTNCSACFFSSSTATCTSCDRLHYLNATDNACIRCYMLFYGCANCLMNTSYCLGCNWAYHILPNMTCKLCSDTLPPLCWRCYNASMC